MDDHTYSVSEIMRHAARVITRAFPDQLWIEGEIRDLNRSQQGHVYFTLVDPVEDDELGFSDGDTPVKDGPVEDGPVKDGPVKDAALPVALFAADKAHINRALRAAGAPRMADGMRVRLRGVAQLYRARSSFQLRMTWIDTDFTTGYLAARRRRILLSLAADGLLDRNKAARIPLVPLRIGLVTSRGSAAEADFITELQTSRYSFSVMSVDARVQGPAAASSLVTAIAAAVATGVQVIAIVRGGGSQSDLDAFDDEQVARAIAASPVPVLTGVGHELDESIADRVAHTAFKTPTACAAAIVARVRRFDEAVAKQAEAIRTAAAAHLNRGAALVLNMQVRVRAGASGQLRRSSHRLETHARRLGPLAGATLARQQDHVNRVAARVGRSGPRRIKEVAHMLEAKTALLAAHDPDRLLRRGWSLVRTLEGTLLNSVSGLSTGDDIIATLADGEAASRVTAVRTRAEGDSGEGEGAHAG